MKAETVSASPASCMSTSQRWRSTRFSAAAYRAVSANVRLIRKKNGSTAKDPGALICANVAEPSSIVLTVARRKISQNTFRRSSVSNMGLGQLADQVEDRQIHRDDDAADDDAEDGDHDGLEQRQEAGDGRVHFFLVEVRDLAEH